MTAINTYLRQQGDRAAAFVAFLAVLLTSLSMTLEQLFADSFHNVWMGAALINLQGLLPVAIGLLILRAFYAFREQSDMVTVPRSANKAALVMLALLLGTAGYALQDGDGDTVLNVLSIGVGSGLVGALAFPVSLIVLVASLLLGVASLSERRPAPSAERTVALRRLVRQAGLFLLCCIASVAGIFAPVGISAALALASAFALVVLVRSPA